MPTTLFIRTAVAATAVVALSVSVSTAEAQTSAGQTLATQTTTGAIPERPAAAPASPPASTQAAPAPGQADAKPGEAPANSVANAVTPAAPAGTVPASAVSPAPSAATPSASDTPAQASPAATPPGETAVTASPPSAPAATTPTTPPSSSAAPAQAATTPASAPQATSTTPPATTPAASTPTAPSNPPAAADAATPPADAVPAQAAAPAAPVVDPVIAAVRTWLGNAANTSKAIKADAAAATAFYTARTEGPLWVDTNGFTSKAKSAMDEVRKADDWGLSAAAFDLPALTGTPSPEALAEAEGKLTLELLKYARFAKGGRVNPSSLSRILDASPPWKDPNTVMTELAVAAAPDAYLRDQHPKHPQFQLLHKALLTARGPADDVVEVDPSLKVSLPATKNTLTLGVDAPAVSLLRQRLKVPAENGAMDTLFDAKLELAVKAYQVEKGIKATGELSKATRLALNKEVDAHRAPDPGRETQLLVINMERWRWMPETLGRVYVWNNIPEYMTRVIKGDDVLFKERIIVGLPQWATPVFSESMKTIVFNPSWGMPDGIKVRELQPRLRAAGGGFFFFGGGGGGSIIRAYGLDVYRGGRRIDPDSVDWSNADVRAYSFIQPPGGKNPLGMVKFLFPNKHDVYMHDTIERSLFAQSSRALSHGCIRVQNPRRFAEVMVAVGNNLDEDGVANLVARGGEITLKNPVPVHMTYFTAVANADGHVSTFSDIYGHDSRLSSALTGRALRYDPGLEMSSNEIGDEVPAESQPQRKKKKYKSGPDTLADAISGFWMN